MIRVPYDTMSYVTVILTSYYSKYKRINSASFAATRRLEGMIKQPSCTDF